MGLITPSIVSERLKVRGSLARRALIELMEKGLIKQVVAHSSQMIYTRMIGDAAEDEKKEEEKGGVVKADKGKSKKSKAEEKAKKKKWSKGKTRDKLNNLVLFDKATYDKLWAP